MRLLSLLPILVLLLAGPLRAQNQCSIYDLTASVTAFSNACEYYVVLDFQHSNTTTQFRVKGNGNNYGTFNYDQLPLKLGPFTAGASPSVREFVVTDIEYPDCQDAVEVQIPGCTTNSGCDIYDVQVSAGDCNNDGLTYQLKLNFKVTNPGNDFFELWAGNGQYLGIYPLNQLPLAFPLFPAGGDSLDEIKICINDHPDCCETVKFQAPDCSTTPCNITNLQVDRGVCTSDSTYKLTVSFNVTGTPIVDQFALFANDDFLGLYSFGDLPLTIDSFPWDGGPKDFIRVCTVDLILDPNNPQLICCKTLEFEVPDCLPVYPCGIKGLTVETDSCTSDSTFGVWINFAVNDSTLVDSFELAGNGHFFGAFSIDSLPLYISDFPWNNGIFSHIKVCTGNDPGCCKELQFLAPSCLPYGPCEITDIFVQTGACTSDSTYKLKINFQATNPGDGTFTLWANGDSLGVFPLDTIPLTLDSFAWNGGDVDYIRICINNPSDSTDCCREKEFHVPDCLIQNNDSCTIKNLVVDPGDCVPGAAAYSLILNFEVDNPGNDFFEVWAGNGQYLGYFPLSDLPLKIPVFPCSNTAKGVLKICINDHPNCCAVVEFQQPNCCSGNDPCEINDLSVQTGDCHNNQTYEVWLNFGVQNPVGDHFGVWANGEFLGNYSLDSLPLYIPDFPWNGGVKDVVKVCLLTPNGAYGCCKTLEFNVPDCLDQPCEIYDLAVVTGDCTGDSTYNVKINFQVANPPGDVFGVWANGEFLGTFNLDSLPLLIHDFPWNGGANDVVKVCFVNANDPNSASCCRTKEFAVPGCLDQGGPCEVYDLSVLTGDCTGDSTYTVKINFQVANPPSDSFGVWANGEFLGYFNVDDLPLLIQDFPWNGGANDVVKVCFDNSCCRTKEFAVPGCLDQGGPCEIYNLTVETGDCTGDSTYQVWINFQVDNPPGNTFGLWINGVFYDTYNLDSLPLYIADFPWNGGQNDVVKVCFTNNNDPANGCCRTKEFAVPGCLNPGGDCNIHDLTVETGDCTSNTTYEVWINFQVDNPPSDQFGVWANGEFLGLFNLDSLPLYIADFPWNGGANDVVKICFPNAAGAVTCCETKEFPVPDCLGQDPCHIYDLKVVKTACLCGEFFAVLTFKSQNGGAEGVDIVGNGNNYGNYPYNTSQPIILGPFPGDGTTNYEFAVKDHLNPDCFDDFLLGVVDCMTPVSNPGDDARLTLSPNPVASWLNVSAQLKSGVSVGEASVEIYHADGRLVSTRTVADGGNFLLDVSQLPAGVYRLSLLASAGRVEGTFAKQ